MTTTPDENTSNISDAAVRREPTGNRRTRVLIVDDEPAVRELMARWVASLGMRPETAANAEEAGIIAIMVADVG